MYRARQRERRGLSPVVGTTLLVAIVVVLVSLSAVLIFGATDTKPPAPEASLQLEPLEGSDDYVLRMHSGERIDGDQLRIQGIATPDVLAGSELTAGRSVRVDPSRETVRVVWSEDAADGVTYTLQTFDVDPGTGRSPLSNGGFPDGALFTGRDGDVIQITGDGGTVSTLLDAGTVEGLGSRGEDVSGDGNAELPFVTSNGNVNVVDEDGDVITVADSSSIPGNVAQQKTRLAVTSWQGSPPAVFFVNQNHDTVYRATPSGSPTVVATPGDGAQSIVGTGDIDGDGTDELVFGDASQTLRYLEPGGSVRTTGVSTGSNNGIGTGTLADFDGDGQTHVAVVDGGNDILLVDDGGGETVTSGDVSGTSAPQAKKAPTAAADVDGDDRPELVYVGNANGDLKYLDDIGGTIEIEFLRNRDGDKIDGSGETGVS